MAADSANVELLRVAEFCRRYNVSVRTFYREVNANRLAVKKIGRSTRVPVSAAQAWLDQAPGFQPQAQAAA